MVGFLTRLGLIVGVALAQPLAAQEARLTAPVAILTIDSDRLFLSSDFGKRVVREIEERGNALAAENRQIEAELAQTEQDLTDRRASMTPEEFRPLADAFDTRVQETRQAQAIKSRDLNAQLEKEREVFLTAAGPVFEELMAEVGATVVLERRTTFFSSNSSDITSAAIARLNASLGDGTSAAPAPSGE
ncbi:OmpH family outer membrane protein [uncultured Sulfitobacter sp.]|uniref:OmpH family outer membrane protein n=1 Tax=uncultured Sulfitobacter sp. TaxID=191468 RepID=UPI0026269E0A|nr:OmpH family outer membrane protein [uncultured Sulfitobacter sp.]